MPNPKKESPSLQSFMREVEASCNHYATRKNYIRTNPHALGRKKEILSTILSLLGIAGAHGVGEIICKIVEYVGELEKPRTAETVKQKRHLMVKIAGWAYIRWRDAEDE